MTMPRAVFDRLALSVVALLVGAVRPADAQQPISDVLSF